MAKSLCLVVVLALVGFCFVYTQAENVDATCTSSFVADFSQPTTDWRHYWETCVGSGHATLGLRQDWRIQLALARKELGFQYVRFHGILDDDMSTYLGNGTNFIYSFFNADSVYDYLLSIGMKPIVELSFMPQYLASGDSTIFHYKGYTSPPTSYEMWYDLIRAFAQHLVDRYGINEVATWNFECWNEPNLGFWNGTQAEYFMLYNYTSHALKSVDSRIRVGGPVTAQSQWLSAFKRWAVGNKVPVDFMSTHEYPTDISPLQRGILKEVFTQAVAEASPIPLYYTEYNCGLGINCDDTSYAAAFVMFNTWDIQPLGIDLMSYWTFTDIFEEGGFDSTPFHQGFGMMSINGIPKPVWRAFELLHRTGDQQVHVTNTTTSTEMTSGAFVIKHSDAAAREIMVIIYNHNVPNAPIKTETVCVTLNGLDASIVSSVRRVFGERIDDDNCNAPKAWEQMGSPAYLDNSQIQELVKVSELVRTTINYQKTSSTSITLESVQIPAEGVLSVTIQY